ncbi:DNA-processing protein DprA [Spiroplasma sp. DGKH1]|uniref:DNA-processing protein DprA n=1 Tax=Spiroplasma sp. DGKH1 TaxID=3050074 RepID=UPI0034C670F9
MNKVLLYFALKYHGDWDQIYQALERKEKISFEALDTFEVKIKCQYITILDPQYPPTLKSIYKPPFVLFYYGDFRLLQNYDQNLLLFISPKPSQYGFQQTLKFIKELVDHQKRILMFYEESITTKILSALPPSAGSQIIFFLYKNSISDFYLNNPNSTIRQCLVISESYDQKSINLKNHIRRIVIALAFRILFIQTNKYDDSEKLFNYIIDYQKKLFCLPDQINKDNKNNRYLKLGALVVENVADIMQSWAND